VKWVNLINPMKDTGILTAYALLIVRNLSQAPVKFHVLGLHKVTRVSTLCTIGNTFGTDFLSRILS
jgi:hypothetical protein